MNKILLVSFLLSLSGCAAAPLVLTGVGVASVAVNETTGRTLSDHVVSGVNGRDCRISRAGKEDICQDDYNVRLKVTTTSVVPSSVEEIESRYR